MQRVFPFFVFRPGIPAASFAAGSVCMAMRLTAVSRLMALFPSAQTTFRDREDCITGLPTAKWIAWNSLHGVAGSVGALAKT
jgi:hypothetical protein